MIIVFVITGAIALLTAVFALTPNFPPIPPSLVAFNATLDTILTQGIQFVRYILTPEITFLVVLVSIGVFVAEPAYHGTMWILRKIPILGIK